MGGGPPTRARGRGPVGTRSALRSPISVRETEPTPTAQLHQTRAVLPPRPLGPPPPKKKSNIIPNKQNQTISKSKNTHNAPGSPVTKKSVSMEHLRKSSPPRQSESVESCRKKGGGPAFLASPPPPPPASAAEAKAPPPTRTTRRREAPRTTTDRRAAAGPAAGGSSGIAGAALIVGGFCGGGGGQVGLRLRGCCGCGLRLRAAAAALTLFWRCLDPLLVTKGRRRGREAKLARGDATRLGVMGRGAPGFVRSGGKILEPLEAALGRCAEPERGGGGDDGLRGQNGGEEGRRVDGGVGGTTS